VHEVDKDALEASFIVVARDGDGAEDLPDQRLGNVDGDEHADAVAEAVFVHDLVQQHCNHGRANQLPRDEHCVPAQVVQAALLAPDYESGALEEDQDDREEFAHGLDALAVIAVGLVLLDEAGVSQQHDDHGGSHDWRDAQLHQGASVRGQDGTQLDKGVCGLGHVDALQRHVGAD